MNRFVQLHLSFACGLAFLSMLSGCSDRNWKETVSLVGQVYVDDKPAEGARIEFHPVGGLDTAQPTVTAATVNKDGSFAASTYEVGDGVPPGEYQLSFTWPKLNPISMTFEGDKLNGRYADPAKTDVKMTVESGKPLDLGRIDLTSK